MNKTQTPPAPAFPFSQNMVLVVAVVVTVVTLLLRQPTTVWLSPAVVGGVTWLAVGNKWNPTLFWGIAGLAFLVAWWQLGFLTAAVGLAVLVGALLLTKLAEELG